MHTYPGFVTFTNEGELVDPSSCPWVREGSLDDGPGYMNCISGWDVDVPPRPREFSTDADYIQHLLGLREAFGYRTSEDDDMAVAMFAHFVWAEFIRKMAVA